MYTISCANAFREKGCIISSVSLYFYMDKKKIKKVFYSLMPGLYPLLMAWPSRKGGIYHTIGVWLMLLFLLLQEQL